MESIGPTGREACGRSGVWGGRIASGRRRSTEQRNSRRPTAERGPTRPESSLHRRGRALPPLQSRGQFPVLLRISIMTPGATYCRTIACVCFGKSEGMRRLVRSTQTGVGSGSQLLGTSSKDRAVRVVSARREAERPGKSTRNIAVVEAASGGETRKGWRRRVVSLLVSGVSAGLQCVVSMCAPRGPRNPRSCTVGLFAGPGPTRRRSALSLSLN